MFRLAAQRIVAFSRANRHQKFEIKPTLLFSTTSAKRALIFSHQRGGDDKETRITVRRNNEKTTKTKQTMTSALSLKMIDSVLNEIKEQEQRYKETNERIIEELNKLKGKEIKEQEKQQKETTNGRIVEKLKGGSFNYECFNENNKTTSSPKTIEVESDEERCDANEQMAQEERTAGFRSPYFSIMQQQEEKLTAENEQ